MLTNPSFCRSIRSCGVRSPTVVTADLTGSLTVAASVAAVDRLPSNGATLYTESFTVTSGLSGAADFDMVATVGENRKVLVFDLAELPEMGRGKGLRLEKFKDGGLSDADTFDSATGLTWLDPAGRTRSETDLAEWTGKRASAGRMAPRGFPRDNKFS